MLPSSLLALASSLFALCCRVPVTRAAPTDVPSAASFYVYTIPNLVQDPTHPLKIFAGHVSSDPDLARASPTDVTAHLYFVMIKNRRVADRERLMFWFNGGPGCSSFDGLMMENGPWRFDDNGIPQIVDGGWEEYTTMVYVDQPAGTGYSYTSTNKYVHDSKEAATQFIQFLENFYRIFPEYKNVDTYFGGESYAGQYIPYFADAVLNSNLAVPLRGAAIGNGWIDARRQYPSYISYAVKHGLIKDQSDEWKQLQRSTNSCVKLMNDITDREPVSIGECENLLESVLESDTKGANGENMCLNMYDVRLKDTFPSCGMNWPKEIKNVTSYLDRQDVVSALHAGAHPGAWQECAGPVHQNYRARNSSITVLPSVIERIPVLVFAGDQDLICNYMGLEGMINAMTWNGQTGFGTVETQSWTVDSVPAGTWVTSRNLTYAKIFNASHMAPYDLPHVGHDMILRFMGVNFSAILEGSAKIPSSLGEDSKPVLQDATQAGPGSAANDDASSKEKAALLDRTFALILLLVLIIIGLVLWWRIRVRRRKGRSHGVHLPQSRAEEEIPLNASTRNGHSNGFRDEDGASTRSRKGKEREVVGQDETVFEVGDSDEEEEKS